MSQQPEVYEQYLGPTISIGLVTEFAKQNALDFTQADGGIQTWPKETLLVNAKTL